MSDYKTEVLALGPVGYWRLGESSGTNAVDEVGTNDGTYTNTPTLGVTGALAEDLDTAVTFASASSEYTTHGDVLDFDRTDPFTLACWMKTSSDTIFGTLMSKYDGTAKRGYLLLTTDAGDLRFLLRSTTTNQIQLDLLSTTKDVVDGAWHHIVATHSGSGTAAGVTMYVDGVAYSMSTLNDNLTTTTVNASNFNIGINDDSANPYNGELDEVAIFDTELTAKQVARLYYTGLGYLTGYAQDVLGLNASGYWRLGEPTGTNAVDETVNSNDGTYTNTPTLAVEGANGRDTDTAVTFASASSEYATMGDVLDFDYNDPLSFSCWFKTTTAADQVLMAKRDGTTPYVGNEFTVTSTGAVRFGMNASLTFKMSVDTTTTGFDDGTWHHAVATHSGSGTAAGITIYVDGAPMAVSVNSDTLGTNTTVNAIPLTIASRGGTTTFFNGSIDEPAIFGTELTAAEVRFLYNSAKYGPAPTLVATKTYEDEVLALLPVGYWRLGEASGTVATDIGSGLNDGTYTNTPTLGAYGALVSDDDKAVTFTNANSEYTTMGDVLDITYDATFSFSIWFKSTYTATTQTLMGKMDHASPFRGYELRTETTGAFAFFIRYSESTNDRILVRTTATGFTDGAWHNVVATYDGSGAASGVSIYVDGVNEALTVATDNLGTNSLATAVSFNVGARNDSGEYFDGTLDEAAYFDTELTAKNVARMYYTGLGHLDRYDQDVLGLAPVGYWRLGESAGTVANDETSAGNDGTYINTPTLGVVGAVSEDTDTAVTFAQATSEYVDMGNVYAFDYNDPFSISCWFKTSYSTSCALVSKQDTVGRGYALRMLASGAIYVQLVNTASSLEINKTSTTTGFNDDVWHYVVMTYDGSNLASGVTIYVDGVALATSTGFDTLGTNTIIDTTSFNIASRDDASLHDYDGEMDEVAVFDYELSSPEQAFLYATGTYATPVPGLDYNYRNVVLGLCPLGYWRLGEASGTNAVDETLRNDGTYTGTPTLAIPGALAGDLDTAVTLNGTTQYVTMGDVLDFDTGDPLSLSCWFKTSAHGGVTGDLITKLTASTPVRGYAMRMLAGGQIYLVLSNTDTGPQQLTVRTDNTFNDGVWHHAVVTYDGSTGAGHSPSGITIYIDGVAEATTVADNTLDGGETIQTTAALQIGCRNSTSGYFDGTIDEPAIFGYELSVKDVAAMYYMGLNKYGYEYEVLKLAPTSYWRLGDASGTVAVDEVGNYAGTYVNTPTLGAASLCPADGVDTAVTFDGVNQYVSMGDNLTWTYDAPFSFCFWVNTTDTAGAYITKYNDLTPKGFTFHVNTSQLAFIWRNTVTSNEMKIFFNSSNAIFDGNDHFAVVTYDGSTNASGVNFYLDGVRQVPTVSADTLSSTPTITDVFCLATQRAGGNIPLNGTLDEVAVFLHELTVQEAHDLYTYGMTYRTYEASYLRAMWEARPIGFWRLGEASGTVAIDQVGLNDGTYTGTPTLDVVGAIDSDTDKAVTFNGTTQYVNVGDIALFDFEYNLPFSASAWFKTTTANYQVIIAKQDHLTPYAGWGLMVMNTGEISFYLINTPTGVNLIDTKTTAATWADGVWHHVVATYDGSTNASGVTIYVDGVSEAVTTVYDTLSATIVNTNPVNIGARNNAGFFFNGSIDEPAIFDYELSATQARRIYWESKGYSQFPLAVLKRDAIGYWRMGDVGPTTAVDELGNQNATGVNTPTFAQTSLVPNQTDSSVDLERANAEYFTVGTTDIVSKKAAQTIMAWVKFEDMGVSHRIWQEEDASSRHALFVDAADNLTFYVDHGTLTNVVGASTLVTGRMYFLAATLGAIGGTRVYVNGILDASDANTAVPTATMTGVLIGAKLAGTNVYFDGVIDDVSVLQEELTELELQEIYCAGLLTYTSGEAGGSVYSEAVSDAPSIAGIIGASADHSATETNVFTEVIVSSWGRSVEESFNWEVGIGIITTLIDSVAITDPVETARYMIGSAVDGVQLALTENIEHAKGVLEGLALNEAWAASTILQGNLSDTLSYADVIQLTWDQLQTETIHVTDSSTIYSQKAAVLAELFVAAGIVSTIHRAAGVIAEAIILQDLAERFFELSATDGLTLTDSDLYLYRAVVANIEAAVMADSLAGNKRLSLLVSDDLVGTDEDVANAICRVLAADEAIFGGTITLPDGVFSAIVLNTESMGVSEYTNYPFNSFGKLGSDYLGASDTNIYQLTGDDDAGTDIDAVIRTGMTNFGTNVFKRVPRAYLGYTSDGGLIMKTISTSGGTKTERWYELTPRLGDHASDVHAAARIKLGRGIKATYWQFELINKLGSDFDIDMLQLYPMILSRRV